LRPFHIAFGRSDIFCTLSDIDMSDLRALDERGKGTGAGLLPGCC
jgi:hypothetical protein